MRSGAHSRPTPQVKAGVESFNNSMSELSRKETWISVRGAYAAWCLVGFLARHHLHAIICSPSPSQTIFPKGRRRCGKRSKAKKAGSEKTVRYASIQVNTRCTICAPLSMHTRIAMPCALFLGPMSDADTTTVWRCCAGAFGKETWAGQRGVFGEGTRSRVKVSYAAAKRKMSMNRSSNVGKGDAEPEVNLLGSHERALPRVDSSDL